MCVCLSVCLSVPPFFRHDHQTATKFGTHADRSGNGSYLKLCPPPQGGGASENFKGQKFKSPGNVINCRENQYKSNPYPSRGLGVLTVNMSTTLGNFMNCHCLPRKSITFVTAKHSIKKNICQECSYPELLHCKYCGRSRVIRGRQGWMGVRVGEWEGWRGPSEAGLLISFVYCNKLCNYKNKAVKKQELNIQVATKWCQYVVSLF